MASEHYKCKGELAITDIEEDEAKHNACGTYFVDINDILNGGKEEEANEPFGEYGMSHESLENNENVEDPTESKFSPAHFWENMNFNGVAGDLSKSKVSHFNNGVMLKNRDRSECNDESVTNNAESKTETIKIEDDIDIIYDNVKPEICEEKSNGKSENGLYSKVTDILIGTEIEPNFSKDSETWPLQNIEEDGSAVETVNDKRKEPTVTTNSNNCQIIQKLSNCDYSKFHPFASKQVFKEKPDTEEKSFQCNFCLKLFNQKTELTRHERIHTGENPFPCRVCSKSFKECRSLLDHERIHTGEKPFQCKFCSESFAVKRKLVHHERNHTGENPFQCKICLKSFYQKGNLTKHKKIHTGDKPFQCKICLKSFIVKSKLLDHEIIHAGEKQFQCNFCSNRYAFKYTLLRHQRIHTGENAFQCKICSKLFCMKWDLTIHERRNTGEKPFQCKICEKSFSRKSKLTIHERIHMKEKPF